MKEQCNLETHTVPVKTVKISIQKTVQLEMICIVNVCSTDLHRKVRYLSILNKLFIKIPLHEINENVLSYPFLLGTPSRCSEKCRCREFIVPVWCHFLLKLQVQHIYGRGVVAYDKNKNRDREIEKHTCDKTKCFTKH